MGTSKMEYLRMLKKEGVLLSDLTRDNFGQELISPRQARKGDVLIEGTGYLQNMGICYGNGVGYFLKENGLENIKTEDCSYAWRVNDG